MPNPDHIAGFVVGVILTVALLVILAARLVQPFPGDDP